MSSQIESLHLRALEASSRYKASESELLRVLEKVRDQKVYVYKGYRSLYEYATKCLGLSEGVSYALQVVLRKSDEVPELRDQILSGEMNLQSARRVASVITPENKDVWIERAKTLPQKSLEREVAIANPQAAVPTRERTVAKDINELRVCLTDRGLAVLKQAQNIMSGKKRQTVDLGTVIEALAEFYVEKTDPVVKAERALERGKVSPPLPAGLTSRASAEASQAVTFSTAPSSASRLSSSKATSSIQMSKLSSSNESSSSSSFSDSPSASSQRNDAELFRANKRCGESVFDTKEVQKEDGRRTTNFSSHKYESQNRYPAAQSEQVPIFRGNLLKKITSDMRKNYRRQQIPAKLRHQVHLRDRGRCTYHYADGTRCDSRRFLDIHHIKPVHKGGENILENLTTLCNSHHRYHHLE